MAKLIVVARISAQVLDIDALARRFNADSLAVPRGRQPRGHQLHDDASHMNISLGDFVKADDAVNAARGFVRDAGDLIQTVCAQNGIVEIDFGMLVGAEESYAPCLTFTTEALKAFADRSVTIAVSAYPCSDVGY